MLRALSLAPVNAPCLTTRRLLRAASSSASGLGMPASYSRMRARSSKNSLRSSVSTVAVRQGFACDHGATAGTSRPERIPSAHDRAYALRILEWMPPASMSSISSRQQRAELRRLDARHALAGGP